MTLLDRNANGDIIIRWLPITVTVLSIAFSGFATYKIMGYRVEVNEKNICKVEDTVKCQGEILNTHTTKMAVYESAIINTNTNMKNLNDKMDYLIQNTQIKK